MQVEPLKNKAVEEVLESGPVDYERLSIRDKVRYNKLMKKGIMVDYKNFRLLDNLRPVKKRSNYDLKKFDFPETSNF